MAGALSFQVEATLVSLLLCSDMKVCYKSSKNMHFSLR